ncbi:hypothetical protein HHS34_006675 [Acidithiobacillus montserratensis]|uniref:Uncharacterized protein n=1 Tax=Acidithiobacillus montserratensis TaxID=2729135 RepID=A0ACD5HJZ6_9PROT|nr:hypothetical protein [Acidithiobacillus montserratensis]MBN2680643.1 hypothetical protein [Acidithiobacillaceae bacterium]MBU2748692.1 hypothetical protein [Acidithiobacillus montserratensis]
MRKEYDLEHLKTKRRGPLPGLSGIPEAPEVNTEDDRVQVTLTLDRDITLFFEGQAQQSGKETFTSAINHALRQYIAALHL